MAEYQVTISRSAAKEFANLPESVIERVRRKILQLSSNPRAAGCKKLEGHGAGASASATGEFFMRSMTGITSWTSERSDTEARLTTELVVPPTPSVTKFSLKAEGRPGRVGLLLH